jgi:hypothetical protein
MRTVVRLLAVATVSLALVAPLSAQAAPVERAQGDPAQVLVGRWVGSYSGYADGRYVKGEEKIVITKAKGHSAKGTWQYREKGGRWSAPQPAQFVISVEDDVDVWGQDSVGYYDGELVGTDRLVFSYVSSSPDQALRFVLTRR